MSNGYDNFAIKYNMTEQGIWSSAVFISYMLNERKEQFQIVYDNNSVFSG